MTDQQKSSLRRAGTHASVIALSTLVSVVTAVQTSMSAVEQRVQAVETVLPAKLDAQRFLVDSINNTYARRASDAAIGQLQAKTDSVLACVRDIAYRAPVRGCR